ncbi:hypothetical protein DMP15_26505 [Pseudonocardia sp. UM4_GMWB1]
MRRLTGLGSPAPRTISGAVLPVDRDSAVRRFSPPVTRRARQPYHRLPGRDTMTALRRTTGILRSDPRGLTHVASRAWRVLGGAGAARERPRPPGAVPGR